MNLLSAVKREYCSFWISVRAPSLWTHHSKIGPLFLSREERAIRAGVLWYGTIQVSYSVHQSTYDGRPTYSGTNQGKYGSPRCHACSPSKSPRCHACALSKTEWRTYQSTYNGKIWWLLPVYVWRNHPRKICGFNDNGQLFDCPAWSMPAWLIWQTVSSICRVYLFRGNIKKTTIRLKTSLVRV